MDACLAATWHFQKMHLSDGLLRIFIGPHFLLFLINGVAYAHTGKNSKLLTQPDSLGSGMCCSWKPPLSSPSQTSPHLMTPPHTQKLPCRREMRSTCKSVSRPALSPNGWNGMEKTERLQAGQKGEGCGLDGSKQKRQIREVFLMSDGGLTHQNTKRQRGRI